KNIPDKSQISHEPGQLKIYLPKKLLECLPKCSSLPKERHRWNTNEEIAAYLITFEKHDEWLTTSPKTRPQNGSMILYNRKKVKYRKDGYCWKKRKDGKTTREDHMKLKVQGVEWCQSFILSLPPPVPVSIPPSVSPLSPSLSL
uniref:CG-1 domain-containing protein n=1 Tax=Oreochromis aureus TaxID=47969 RepID=A0A668SMY2_OREAU